MKTGRGVAIRNTLKAQSAFVRSQVESASWFFVEIVRVDVVRPLAKR
jgi:hypothetical protein